MDEIAALIIENFSDHTIFNDALVCLEYLQDLNWKQACVSASPQQALEDKLKKADISDYFDFNCPKKLCHNINEIIERTAKILSADKDFCSEHLTRIYGSYNDGKVRKRIVGWVENKIFELIHIK